MPYYQRSIPFVLLLLAYSLFPSSAGAQFVERGGKIAGSGTSRSAAARQGSSVALSADGTTAIEGGPNDARGRGAAWVFTRSGAAWVQQGEKLVANDAVGERVFEGRSVALSADGNTALIGGDGDDEGIGAAWVFARTNGVWTEQAKLLGASSGPGAAGKSGQGSAVALSADGNTALVGGMSDDNGAGAAWVFIRSGEVWTQQGGKLVGSGADGSASQGRAVALAANGNTALIGGSDGHEGAWIFKRSGEVWTQQGSKLSGPGTAVSQGYSAALSGDGNTAVIGKPGGAWVFARSGEVWAPQGDKLSVADGPSAPGAPFSVALSGDGSRLLLGGPNDDGGTGAAWEFRRVNGSWTPIGKLVGKGASGKAQQGYAVAISADGHTALLGGILDGRAGGAVWTFGDPTLAISAPASAAAGMPVTVTVTAQDDTGKPVSRYAGMVHFTSSDAQANLPADAPLAHGVGTFSLTLKTSGPQTISAADTAIATIALTSDPVAVTAAQVARFLLEAPASAVTGQEVPVSVVPVDQFNNPAEYRGGVQWNSSDLRATLPAVARLNASGSRRGTAPLAVDNQAAVTFRTAGKQTVTVTGAADASLTATAATTLAPSQQVPSYVSAVLSTNPLAYFRLQAANDTSQVNGYTSTFQGGATLATPGAPICDPNNSYASLDGATGWVSTSLSGGVNAAGSMVAWVNLASLPSAGTPIRPGFYFYVAGESQNGDDFDLQFTPDNYIRFYVSDNSVNVGYLPNTSTLVGQWHMIAATFDSSTNMENLYWDGQPVATATNTAFTNKTTQFTIGESPVFTGRYLDGGIDEVAVWNYALTAQQVAVIYGSSNCPLPESDSEKVTVTDSVNLVPGLVFSDNETIHVTDTESLGQTVEFKLPAGLTPADIVAVLQSLYFTGVSVGMIGMFTPPGMESQYPTLTLNSKPFSIVFGPDGALWFTEQSSGKIGRITTAGVVTEFNIPTANSTPAGIAAGPDGALWFAESATNKIGRITSAGMVTEFNLPSSGMDPERITPGPDGALWFTESMGNQIGRITTAGMVTLFNVPTANSSPLGIVAGPDGALWFTESMGNQIGRISTAGMVTEFPIPTANSVPKLITAGPDGALWFTESMGNKIGRISTDPTVTEFPVPTASAGPYGITPGPGGAVWYTEESASQLGQFATGVTGTPALSIQSSHSGVFTPGELSATYTLTVTDAAGAGSTAGMVTVLETLPTGLTLVSMSGTGWTCPSPGGVPSGTCTRSDPLAGGSPYPPITVTVNVAASATSPQVNTASAFGGGSLLAVTTDATVIAGPVALSIAKSHSGNFVQGQQNAAYTVTVSNAAGAQSSSGTVTVIETVPSGLTLVSMAGTGWTCASGGNSCTRSDALAGGASYPITVTVNVASNAASQVTNQATVSGGGSAGASASDPTTINAGQPPAAVTVFSPGQGATGVSPAASLTWGAAIGAVSYNVYFGTATPPPLVTNTASTSFAPTMNPGSTYYWSVTAVNTFGSAPSAVWSFTTASSTACSFALAPASASLPATGTLTVETCPNNSGQPNCGVVPETPATFTVTPSAACGAWTATSSNPEFLQITSGASGSGGTVSFTLLNNTHTLTQNYTITVSSATGSATYPVAESGSGDSEVYREVYALYEQLLGRDPDPGGFAFWTGAGGAGLGQMADSFLTSPEAFNSDFTVMAAYQAATNAPPTFAQFTTAVAALRAGTQTVPGLFNSLIGSGYTAAALYQNLLNRQPAGADSACIDGGLATCFQTIIGYPSSTTPVGATNNEFQSTGTYHTTLAADHTNALYVQMIYYVTVSRDPDAAGLAFWIGVANSGGPGVLFQGTAGYSTRIQILGPGTPNQGFIGSPEFQGLFAN